MRKLTLILIFFVYFLNTSCGDEKAAVIPEEESLNESLPESLPEPEESSPVPNEKGEIIIDIDSEDGAVISASQLQKDSNDPLSQFTKVEIPRGALNGKTEIKIFETQSVVEKVEAKSFGLTEIKKAGPSIVIKGNSTAIATEITVSIPYDKNLISLFMLVASNEIALLVVSDSDATILSGNKITVSDTTVKAKSNKFGVFQVIKYTGNVETETTAVAQVSEDELKSVEETKTSESVISVETPVTTTTATTNTTTTATTAEATTTTTLADPDLSAMVGTWAGVTTGYTLRSYLILSETELSHIIDAYDSDRRLTSRSVVIYEISVNADVIENEIHSINKTYKHTYITPYTAAAVETMEQAHNISFEINTATKLTGVANTSYDSFKISGDKLYFAQVSVEKDGSSEEKRPSTMASVYWTKTTVDTSEPEIFPIIERVGIDGAWVTGCMIWNVGYQKQTLTFSGTTVTSLIEIYTDSSCETKILKVQANRTLSETPLLIEGEQTYLTMNQTEMIVTPYTEYGLQIAQALYGSMSLGVNQSTTSTEIVETTQVFTLENNILNTVNSTSFTKL